MTAGGGAVVALAGRRIDATDATTERFPLRNVTRVRAQLEARLSSFEALHLVCSAACGADLLALDVARARGIQRRIILPFEIARFRTESVVDRPGDWGGLFDALIANALATHDLVILGGDDTSYAAANMAILAEAEALAAPRNLHRTALIVWDGESRGEDDLTVHFRDAAAQRGWLVEEVATQD